MQRLTGVYFPKRLQVLHKLSRGQSKTGDVEARLSLECLWFSTNSFSLKERDRTGNTKKIQEQEYTLLQCLYQTFRHLVTFTEGILIKCQYRASLKPDCSHLENKTKFTDG